MDAVTRLERDLAVLIPTNPTYAFVTRWAAIEVAALAWDDELTAQANKPVGDKARSWVEVERLRSAIKEAKEHV